MRLKLIILQASKSTKPSIDIYSSAEKLHTEHQQGQGRPIKGMGWSEDEKLLVVTADGTVRCYYDLQGDFTQFSLGNGAEEFGVDSCRFYGRGLVALLSNNSLISVPSYDDPRPKLLTTPPEGQVHSWTIILTAVYPLPLSGGPCQHRPDDLCGGCDGMRRSVSRHRSLLPHQRLPQWSIRCFVHQYGQGPRHYG